MMKILDLNKDQTINLDPKKASGLLNPDEVMHIAQQVGAFWSYNYDASNDGKVGMHAQLKSEKHSDGFFISRELLKYDNLLTIFALQIVMLLNQKLSYNQKPDLVYGVPDGATSLASRVALFMGLPILQMKKEDGKIIVAGEIKPGAKLLPIEDICTTGKGFIEAAEAVIQVQPEAKIIPFDPVIINRGGLTSFESQNIGKIEVLPVANIRINDWDPGDCPLCKMGSTPIKPKATDENWIAITTSQQ